MYKFKILHVLLNVPPYDYDEEEKKRMKRQITDDMLTKSCSLMERLKKSKFPEIDYKCLYLSALVTPTRGKIKYISFQYCYSKIVRASSYWENVSC